MDKKTILIVDDNADTRLLLSARLKANHYHTVFAADALQAISVALKEH
jgi:CheY-like chemotaxis protein